MTDGFGPRDVVRLAVGAVVTAGVVTALALVVGFTLARTLQWALLGAGCTVAVMLLGRLHVPHPHWPDLPQPPPMVGWHGLRSAQERLRRSTTTGGRRRRTTPQDDADPHDLAKNDAEG